MKYCTPGQEYTPAREDWYCDIQSMIHYYMNKEKVQQEARNKEWGWREMGQREAKDEKKWVWAKQKQ